MYINIILTFSLFISYIYYQVVKVTVIVKVRITDNRIETRTHLVVRP